MSKKSIATPKRKPAKRKLSAASIQRISNRVDYLIGEIMPRDPQGVLVLTLQQKDDIQAFNDWLDENFGPFE